jgi:ACR3 family arsenite transporter
MKSAVTERVATSPGSIGFFEKWLSVWVALCIVVGIGLGNVTPDLFQFFAGLEYASVNLVVAVLIWGMVYPMMVNVDFTSLRHIGERPKGLCQTNANQVEFVIPGFQWTAQNTCDFQQPLGD